MLASVLNFIWKSNNVLWIARFNKLHLKIKSGAMTFVTASLFSKRSGTVKFKVGGGVSFTMSTDQKIRVQC